MKLKGLVWFFTIVLIVISLFLLSYTWVIRSFEGKIRSAQERIVKQEFPGLSQEERNILTDAKTDSVLALEVNKDKKIYPLIGTTYQRCKENELNLGLDLQGGMNVTLDVSLEGLIKSLSNDSKNPQLLKAIKASTDEKVKSTDDYITLFEKNYKSQNAPGSLALLFAGGNTGVKATDTDNDVIAYIRKISSGAIKQTYDILTKRIDKFGVTQPSINLDENKGIINVELAGVTDVERVKKLLQASAHLQFWEVYRIDELAASLKIADENLHNYLNGVSGDTTGGKPVDTLKAKKNVNPFFQVINPLNAQTDKNGKQFFPAAIGNVALKDTSLFFEYLNNDVVKTALPADCKFLFGVEEKAPHNTVRFHPMLDWDNRMITKYIKEHNLPKHPLEDKGYMSIGCEPCTRAATRIRTA